MHGEKNGLLGGKLIILFPLLSNCTFPSSSSFHTGGTYKKGGFVVCSSRASGTSFNWRRALIFLEEASAGTDRSIPGNTASRFAKHFSFDLLRHCEISRSNWKMEVAEMNMRYPDILRSSQQLKNTLLNKSPASGLCGVNSRSSAVNFSCSLVEGHALSKNTQEWISVTAQSQSSLFHLCFSRMASTLICWRLLPSSLITPALVLLSGLNENKPKASRAQAG